MNNYQTEQEDFWAGVFGDEYTDRNSGEKLLASKINFFSKVLQRCNGGVDTVLELGANQGLNLRAIGILLPNVKMTAVEINKKAAEKCKNIDRVTVLRESIFDFKSDKKFDLTFTKGVLIHINPEKLADVYKKLYDYIFWYYILNILSGKRQTGSFSAALRGNSFLTERSSLFRG